MRKISALPGLVFVVIVAIGSAFAYFEYTNSAYGESLSIAVGAFVIAVVASYSIKIADQWDRTVVLRLGHFRSLKGPGLFFIIPIIETMPYWIDTRVITQFLQGGKDPDERYGASGCRCRVVLESGGPKEGGARRGRLWERHQLGLPNGSARRDRQDHAFGHAGG